MSVREFHISTILSITTGILMPSLDDVHQFQHMKDLVGFIAGMDDASTLDVRNLADYCTNELRKQLYFIDEIKTDGVNEKTVYEFLDQMEIMYGEYHAIEI